MLVSPLRAFEGAGVRSLDGHDLTLGVRPVNAAQVPVRPVRLVGAHEVEVLRHDVTKYRLQRDKLAAPRPSASPSRGTAAQQDPSSGWRALATRGARL